MSKIWAVACNTIAQALRMKVAILIILLLLILLPMLGAITEGDGTLKGKLQTFVSYSLSLTNIMLSGLAIAMSIFCVTDDVRRKQIFLVATKPVRRSQIILGKFFGLTLLNTFLLAVYALVIYGATLALPKINKSPAGEIEVAKRQFFTARKVELPAEQDENELRQIALDRYSELEETNQLPETMTNEKILKELYNQERMKTRSVEVGKSKTWDFNLTSLKSREGTLFVQFEYAVATSTPDNKVLGQWEVGDFRQEEQYDTGDWKTNVYIVPRRDAMKTQYEFEVPADCVADDGYVAVRYLNPYENNSTIIPKDIKLLYKAGSFDANYAKVVLVILSRLIFLTACGIFAGTWLSFPVAVLMAIVVLCMGLLNSFFVESISALAQTAKLIYSFTIMPILWMLPKFDSDYNPLPYIVSSKLLSTSFLGQVYLTTALIKPMVLLFFSVLIFRAKELAKVTT